MALRKLNKIAAAVAATMAMGAAQADSLSFSRMYTLGDSLTDGGAYTNTAKGLIGPTAPNIAYRFINNAPNGSSRTYAEILAARLGLSLPVIGIPLYTGDGSNGGNYAQGGSRVTNPIGTSNNPEGGVTTFPVTRQVQELLADRARFTKDDLILLWAGANDGLAQANAVVTPPNVSPATAAQAMGLAATQLAAEVGKLRAAGAERIVVVLLPDLAATPSGFAGGAQAQALLSILSNTFNSTLQASLAAQNTFIFDSNKVLSAIVANPTRFGFDANPLASFACSTPSALVCIDGVTTRAGNFLFADGVHPSTQAHAIFGEILMGSLRAIGQASNLATGPMIAARQHAMELENRLHLNAMQNADGKARAVGKVHVYGGAEAGGFKDSAGQVDPSVDMSTQRYRIGIDQQFSTSTMGGVLLSYGNGKTDFGGGTGQIKTDEVTATAYISKALSQNTYINASIGMGTIDHDFQRTIALDTTTLNMLSKPKGRYESYRVGGGGVYDLGGWKIGPNASLAHEKVTIERFEEGAGPASMSFGEIDYSVQRFSLGLSIDQAASVGQWRGFGRLVHDWDLKSDDLKIRVGHAAGTLASFDIDRPKTLWQATVGIMRPASDGSTLSLSVGMGGRDGGGDTRIIGVNYRIEL